jgi:HK97 family phage major capsid protein
MSLTTSGGASILAPEEVSALVVRPLMEQSVAAQVSTVVPTTSHDFRVPVVSADPTAAWTAEGSEIAVSDPTITEVVVTPKKLAGLTVITNELAMDSSPAALQVVGDGLVRDLKRKLDSAFFGNTVANGPNGLGSLTTTVIDAGDSWTNLDAFEGAKSAAETLHTNLTAFVTNWRWPP